MGSETGEWIVERFWAKPTDPVALDQWGYLADPTAPIYGVSPNPHIRDTKAVCLHDCVVLLGEPGIGKTRALRGIRRALRATIAKPDEIRLVGLKDYSNE